MAAPSKSSPRAGPSQRPIAPNINTSSSGPQRKDTYPPHTPSALSNVSSPVASTSAPPKRALEPASDTPNCRGPTQGPERKSDRPQSIIDPATGKKKRISLSCAQREAKAKGEASFTDIAGKSFQEHPAVTSILTPSATESTHVNIVSVPYTPVSSSNNTAGLDPATQERLERMENVLSVVVRHNPGIGGYDAVREWLSSSAFQRFLATTPSTPVSPSALIPHHLHNPASSSGSNRPKVASTPHTINTDEIEHIDKPGEEESRIGKGWLGDVDGGVPETMRTDESVTMRIDMHGTPAENLQRLITDCGVSPHKVQELIQELPPKPFADRLIDWFFSNLNLVRYPIDERLFRISYEDLYNKTTSVDPANVRALPLVFIVLAMAVRLVPEGWAGDENTRKISSLRMYWSSRRSILIATALQSESIELVVTRLLSAMYLVQIHDRRLTECWSQLGASLRTAQAIGLHRDGTKLGLDPFQTEYRRRLWSYLYHADRLYSLILGRPPSISDAYTDALPPSNVDLNEYDLHNAHAPLPQPKPLSEPTTATFLILRRQLSAIIGRIVHHFQKLNEPAQYADVQRLQEELDQFTQSLPPHFRMKDADKSLDKQHFWLPVHRFTLLTEVLVTTIILHRPWLLRRLSSNRYSSSRVACFESAKLDFEIRQSFAQEVPNSHMYSATGPFKMFNSAMIAGISAIIDPRGSDSEQMRRILSTFLRQHPLEEIENLDETTKKEVSIIHTLSRRAAQIFEDTMGPGELNAQDKDSVALLLGLRQGEDPSSSAPPPTPAQSGAGGQVRRPTQSWTKYITTYGQPAAVQPSPASSEGEDHSQRLLDQWLAQNSMDAVVPFSPSVSFGFPNIPQPLNPSLTPMPFPHTPPTFGNPAQTPGPSTQHNQHGQVGTPIGGGFVWGSGGEEHVHQELPTGLDGTVLGVGSVNAEGRENDEYWNTLIDGILGGPGMPPSHPAQ
ncbi:hypothetical protein A1Q2_01922 [Trichosporon asahii var. asahii CBS 8904]|uniref:Xylanolytic transcriptional activator regulatory domain-containing protein n=1 Tax=Trichosporon asahii var. asahii (strain CBS 8904) TaxID=1220162 RepID=K1WSE5_TRIAC|nr:hypothetical protein A1Q2_01922 [Trichosporon asahii var. asahii CBS 8904]